MQAFQLTEVTSDKWFHGEGVCPSKKNKRFPVVRPDLRNKGVGHLCSFSGFRDGQ